MQKRINLIPLEMAVPAKAVKLAKFLNKISIIGVFLLLFSVILVIIATVFYSFELNKTVSNVNSLKSKITSLEQNEQKLFLAKDRVAKIVQVKKLASVQNEIAKFRDFSNLVSAAAGSSFSEISIDSKKTELTINSQDSTSLSGIFKIITDTLGYKNIILSSLGFSQSTGFISTLVFNLK